MLLRVLYLERMRREPSAWHLAETANVRAPERLVFRQTVEGWRERAGSPVGTRGGTAGKG
jgi:hypothetical protein